MTDIYQPIRDYAQAQLPKFAGRFDAREDYIRSVVKYAATNGQFGDLEVMMTERIARHAWDSVNPHKYMSDTELTLAAAKRKA